MHGNRTLTVGGLLDNYESGEGSDYRLTKSTFYTFVNDMYNAGKLKDNTGVPVPNIKGLYQVTVNTHGTSYYYAVGLITNFTSTTRTAI